MKIGLSVFGESDLKEVVKLYKKYGINRSFINQEKEDFNESIKIFNENGIICETIHAPTKRINTMWEDGDEGETMLGSLMDTVDKCNENNIPVAVVHVSKGRPMPPMLDIGFDRFNRLLEYAKEKNVKIAFENLRYWENVEELLNRHPDAGFCWDAGHEKCYTPDREFMKAFGNRVEALHIHDNACVYDVDEHVLPFDGNIDMEAIARHIAKSGYKGTLMLEITKKAKLNGERIYERLALDEYIERAVKSAEKLIEIIKKYKI